MSRKRRNTSSPEASPEPPAKRQAANVAHEFAREYDSDDADPDEKPYINQESGQTGAFPGLGDEEDEGFYGPANDGIDYLRMKRRSEARSVPSLLTSAQNDGSTDQKKPQAESSSEVGSAKDGHRHGNLGYYEDGAYSAAPDTSAETTNDAPLSPSQTRSYEVMLAQFRQVQATLRCQPPFEKIQALGEDQPISFPSGNANAEELWQEMLTAFEPNIVQIACMNEESVANLLRLIKREFEWQINREGSVRYGLGTWLWACLAKMPDLGTLDSDEVAELRELGKIAATAVEELYIGEPDRDDKEVAQEHAEYMENDADSLIGHAKDNRIILDMVITVVGEVYGQRDLLPKRVTWKWKSPEVVRELGD
ncbi:uncharacterized protein AB675_5314 [Cyphellophora attinorum]|uniref:Uncharacterized protein n=1 Tax=Cyphellophora attinorum TaxID=1664694 RepID=A0A0N1H6Q2_9EURO|nr:uncharacterized protein AB675_5314 [Phialophora attinorum]KPI41793.1 hypothetical protein AB675_5314 [Phialophora attinorum]